VNEFQKALVEVGASLFFILFAVLLFLLGRGCVPEPIEAPVTAKSEGVVASVFLGAVPER